MSRKVGGCSSGLERKLVLYTLSAAGAVAFTPPAGAQVIYTATNLLLTGGTLPIDLNHDGVEDFSLINREYANFYYSGGFGNRPRFWARTTRMARRRLPFP